MMGRPRQTAEAIRAMLNDYHDEHVQADTWEPAPGYAAAYVLALGWPNGAVLRYTLAALVPLVDDKHDKLIHALRWFESRGWLEAGRVAVFVHDADALRDYALSDAPSRPLSLRDFCNVRQALAILDAAAGTGSNGEQARQAIEREYLASRA